MDDDLNVSAALAVVHETVTAGNTALADRDKDATRDAAARVRAMTAVLGVDPLDAQWTGGPGSDDDALRAALDVLVRAELDARAAARAARTSPPPTPSGYGSARPASSWRTRPTDPVGAIEDGTSGR